MSDFNSSTPISLEWRLEFEVIIKTLEERWSNHVSIRLHTQRFAHALLTLIHQGATPTTEDIIKILNTDDDIHNRRLVSRRQWMRLAPSVIQTLKDRPLDILVTS